MKPRNLSEIQTDTLREVGSIGAGHSATALSQLVDHRIELGVPRLDLLEVVQIPAIFGGPEKLVAAVYARVLGDVSGSIILLLDRSSSLALVDLLHGGTIGTTKSLGESQEATIVNAASILISAYLASVGRLAELNVLPGQPAFAFDMVGAILEAVAAEIGLVSDDALVIRTEFRSNGVEDEEQVVDAFLLFMPDEESLDTLLGHLGVT